MQMMHTCDFGADVAFRGHRRGQIQIIQWRNWTFSPLINRHRSLPPAKLPSPPSVVTFPCSITSVNTATEPQGHGNKTLTTYVSKNTNEISLDIMFSSTDAENLSYTQYLLSCASVVVPRHDAVLFFITISSFNISATAGLIQRHVVSRNHWNNGQPSPNDTRAI